MVRRPRAERSLLCHLHCCSPLKQRSAFNPFRRSCALPTNTLMFNSFLDTWGTLITTTGGRKKKKKKQKEEEEEGEGRRVRNEKELNVCFVFAIVGWMKGRQQDQTSGGSEGTRRTNKSFPSVLFDSRRGWRAEEMVLDTSACSLLIRGWLSALSEAWIRGLPSDSAKLVGREGRQSVERCWGNFWCVSQRVWHGLLLLTFPSLICDRSPGAGRGRWG